MPQEIDTQKIKIFEIEGDEFPNWPLVTGRKMFESRSITGLNKIPIGVHKSLILSDTDAYEQELPFPIDQAVEGIIVDGTVIVEFFRDKSGAEMAPPEFLTNIVEASRDRVVRRVGVTTDGKIIHRIYRLEGDTWQFEDVTGYKTDEQAVIAGSQLQKNKDSLYIFINGNGILYDAQDTYRRLEEIERRVRKVTNNAVAMIISGWGGNLVQAQEELNSGSDKIIIPRAVEITLVASTQLTDQFHADYEKLLRNYFILVNVTLFDESTVESGVSRRYRMAPMLHYVRDVQRLTTKLYKESPVGGLDIKFGRLITSTPEERKAELELLDSLKARGVITDAEYKVLARKLVQ